MLKYLVNVTEALLVAAILSGMLYAYGRAKYKNGKRIMNIALIAGLVAAALMAFMKNKTKLIDTGMWNIGIFLVTLTAFILLVIFDKKLVSAAWRDMLCALLCGILLFSALFYALPDVIAYPYSFVLGGEVLLSTGFLYRLIGMIGGLILMLVIAFAAYHSVMRAGLSLSAIVLKLCLLINSIAQVCKIIQKLNAKKVKGFRGHGWFQISMFSSNHSDIFIYAVVLCSLLLPMALLARSMRVNEPYENPAQHRLIRAKWRSVRRWSAALLICFILAVFNMTAVKAYDSREVSLSPVEELRIEGDTAYVSFEQLADGHLHRFGYVSPAGVQIRFIAIKKPNSKSYGIGMDACEICGETGYYEKDGQVVCKRCDVVMNINTIGFKGGCNPLVLKYAIEDGNIVIPVENLMEYEGKFGN